VTHGGRTAKARRLQTRVAEDLSRAFGLSIEAEPPTKPGRRNGALWVAEGSGADLRVRRMGSPGDDVALLTDAARRRVRLPGRPAFAFECKNAEAWDLDAVWRSALRKGHGCVSAEAPAFMRDALRQLTARIAGDREPVVVLGKNNWPDLALLARDPYDLFPEAGGHGGTVREGKFVRDGTDIDFVSPRLWLPGVGTIVLWGWLVEVMRKGVER